MAANVQFPQYSVKYYREGVYKLTRFHRPLMPHLPGDWQEGESAPDEKLAQAISRARSVIYQVAFCNDWDYFFTGTISPDKYNRYHLADFYKSFTQWLRDYRKKYRCDLKYLFVPELHEDGAWHIHGFVKGIPEGKLCSFIRGLHPRDLVDNGYLNWPDYAKKFGFCSLAEIKDLECAAGYVTKYVTKDLARCVTDYGGHVYRCSIGLARALPMGYVYGSYAALDAYLEYDGVFCSNGWVRGVDWLFWLDYISVDGELPPIEYLEDIPVMMTNTDMQQLTIEEWSEGGNVHGRRRNSDL